MQKEAHGVFYLTAQIRNDFDIYERFRFDDSAPHAPVVIGEQIIPAATSPGASFVRNIRFWDIECFHISNAPLEAKAAFKRWLETRNPTSPKGEKQPAEVIGNLV